MSVYACRRCGMTTDVQHDYCRECGASWPYKPVSPSSSTPAQPARERGAESPARWFRPDGTPLASLPGTGRVFAPAGAKGAVHEVDPTTGYGVGFRLYKPTDPDYPTAVGLAIKGQGMRGA